MDKPYLLSFAYLEQARGYAYNKNLKHDEYVWIPLLSRYDRENKIRGRHGYTTDKLIGYFDDEEVEYLTHITDKPKNLPWQAKAEEPSLTVYIGDNRCKYEYMCPNCRHRIVSEKIDRCGNKNDCIDGSGFEGRE